MSKHTLTLAGCAPVPLAHYLKALGVLRIVSEQADPSAQGCWQHDQFLLRSCFDREALLRFLLETYRPTPVLAPWNGGSGFYFQEEKLNQKDPITGKKVKTGVRNQSTAGTCVIEKILKSTSDRFERYRATIALTQKLLQSKGFNEAPEGGAKDDLLIQLRAVWPDDAVRWLDCVAVLTNGTNPRSATGLSPAYTTLLGSGANDGNADFTSNFMQRLTGLLLDAKSDDAKNSRQQLQNALFGDNYPETRVEALAGQYSPGTAGGANSTTGFSSKYSVNPWDYVLLIEGALMFAAAAVRKHETNRSGAMAYPFCVRSSGVGYASAALSDELADKANTEEMWLPLWSRLCTCEELMTVFGEGRSQLPKRKAVTGIDFTRAIVGLGVDRGITEFQRIGFFVRNGKSVFATPLGRVSVRRNARADLLADVDQWLDRLRHKALVQEKPKAPASVRRTVNQIERDILDLCRDGSSNSVQSVLRSLGRAEQSLAKSLKWTTKETVSIRPLHSLSQEWIEAANTNTREYRLAVSIAGMRVSFGQGKETLWLRQHLEPLKRMEKPGYFRAQWSEKSSESDVVWHEGHLTDAFNDILARRIIRVEQSGAEGWPDWSTRYAKLEDITDFIEGRTDDGLLADLLWGLSLIDWQKVRETDTASCRTVHYNWKRDEIHRAVPSSFYALLKLCFRRAENGEEAIPLVPAIHNRARSGQGLEASRLAVRRLRGSGLAPLVNELPIAQDIARRTAAALIFPVSPRDLSLLEQTIIKQPENQNA
jgi:CRISPR-associated protein Csx17